MLPRILIKFRYSLKDSRTGSDRSNFGFEVDIGFAGFYCFGLIKLLVSMGRYSFSMFQSTVIT